MIISKTAACKLKLTNEEKDKLFNTLQAFRDACNHISKIAFEKRAFHPIILHHLTYYEVKQRFGLVANMAIRARDRVAKAYKQHRNKLLKFDKLSMDLDKDLFRLIQKPDGFYVSLSTIKGRIKPSLNIGEYQRKLLNGIKPTCAILAYKNKQFFLHIMVEKEIPEPKGNNPIGVDIGINNLLVASNGFKINGKSIAKRRERFRNLRSSLQAKGTRSAKRHLKRLGNSERRWANTVLHQVSKQFVNSLHNGDFFPFFAIHLNHFYPRPQINKSSV